MRLNKILSSLSVAAALVTSTLAAPAASAAYSTTPPEGDFAQAIVRIGPSVGFCSGAMISPHWVLTARHCIEDDDYGANFTTIGEITIGDKPSNSRKYEGKTYLHPDTDLALININGTYTGPTLSLIDHRVDKNDTLYGAGFGGTPHQATAYTLTDNTYRTVNSKYPLWNGARVEHYAHGKDKPIKGDSGSPVITDKGEIVSVISNGDAFYPETDAATVPSVSVSNPDVNYYRDWIMETAGLSDIDPAQDSGPSDARWGDFAGEVARVGSSLTPADLGADKDMTSSNTPIGPMAIISLVLGLITAGIISLVNFL